MEIDRYMEKLMIEKPLLAHKIEDIDSLPYPVYASPKLDGIRALYPGGDYVLVSRKFKPIANMWMRETLEPYLTPGLDGEIIVVRNAELIPFNEVSSFVMTQTKNPLPKDYQLIYFVFDLVKNPNDPFDKRYNDLLLWHKNLPDETSRLLIQVVPHYVIKDKKDLLKFESECLKQGFEGIMVRRTDGRYKFGRSTVREGIIGKLKRFEDAEGIVIGFEELMVNNNPAEKDEFGRTKRSAVKENLAPAGMLGALIVEYNGHKFSIGTGFDQELRKMIWKNQPDYLGALVKFKFQPAGMLEAPRFPVFLGFRSQED